MRSILQEDEDICFLCGLPAGGDPLDWHHIFGGALRKKSEKYGLKVRLHHSRCHIFEPDSAHQSGKTAELLHKAGQEAAMREYGWTVEETSGGSFTKIIFRREKNAQCSSYYGPPDG